MGFNLSDSQQGNKERKTLQPNQLKYIEDVLGCFCDLAVAKKAVKDISFFEEEGYDATTGRPEDDKWYAVQRDKSAYGRSESRTIITVGLKDKGNHVVDAKKDIKSGQTFIGANPNVDVERIANSYIEEHMRSGYRVEFEGFDDKKGGSEKKYRFKDAKETELKYENDGVWEEFIYTQSGIEVRSLKKVIKNNIIMDSRCVNENGINREINQVNNYLIKKDERGFKYSIGKHDDDLKLEIVIPPEEEMGDYIERSEKIESTK